MESFEIEGAAIDLYRRAGLDPSSEFGAVKLARRLPGVSVEFVTYLARTSRMHANDNGSHVIAIDRRLSPIAQQFGCGHELGHVAHGRECVGYDAALERACTSIGVAICVPSPAMYRARLLYGLDLESLASEFGMSQTILALRWGEVFDEPVALVTSRGVWRRGPDVLPPDTELRRIATAGGSDQASAVPLTDAKRRTLVIARDF